MEYSDQSLYIFALACVIAIALISIFGSAFSRKAHDNECPLDPATTGSTYLDNNATTQAFRDVIRAVACASTTWYANPSSMHDAGKASHAQLEECRRDMLHLAGAEKAFNLVFTSGATESNNLVIRACIRAFVPESKDRRACVITTPLEHPSVYETLQSMPNIDVFTLGVDKDGLISMDELRETLTSNRGFVVMVCVSVASSEVGTLQDAMAISEACRMANVHCHLDMTQLFGRYHVDLGRLDCDSATLSAHKFHGPKGVGGLFYTKRRPPPTPCTTGGKQEAGVRGGTENLPAILGMNRALKECHTRLQNGAMRDMTRITTNLWHGIQAIEPTARLNGPTNPKQRLYQTLSITLQVPAYHLVEELSKCHVYVGVGGCACAKGKYSKAMAAMGIPTKEVGNTIRVSVSFLNTDEHVHKFLHCLDIALASLRVLPAFLE